MSDFFTKDLWPFSPLGSNEIILNNILYTPNLQSNPSIKNFTDYLTYNNTSIKNNIVNLNKALSHYFDLINTNNFDNFTFWLHYISSQYKIGIVNLLNAIMIFYIYISIYIIYNSKYINDNYWTTIITPKNNTQFDNIIQKMKKLEESAIGKIIIELNRKSNFKDIYNNLIKDHNSLRFTYGMSDNTDPVCSSINNNIYYTSTPKFDTVSKYFLLFQGLIFSQIYNFLYYILGGIKAEDSKDITTFFSDTDNIDLSLTSTMFLYFILNNIDPTFNDVCYYKGSEATLTLSQWINLNYNVMDHLTNFLGKNGIQNTTNFMDGIFPLFCCTNTQKNLQGMADDTTNFTKFFKNFKINNLNIDLKYFLGNRLGNFTTQSFFIFRNFFNILLTSFSPTSSYINCNPLVPNFYYDLDLNIQFLNTDYSKSFSDDKDKFNLIHYYNPFAISHNFLSFFNDYDINTTDNKPIQKSGTNSTYLNIFEFMCNFLSIIKQFKWVSMTTDNIPPSTGYFTYKDSTITPTDQIQNYITNQTFFYNRYCGYEFSQKIGDDENIIDYCRQDMCISKNNNNNVCATGNYNRDGFSDVQFKIKEALLVPFNKYLILTSNGYNNLDSYFDTNLSGTNYGDQVSYDKSYPTFFKKFCGYLTPPDASDSAGSTGQGLFAAINGSSELANIFLKNPECIPTGFNPNNDNDGITPDENKKQGITGITTFVPPKANCPGNNKFCINITEYAPTNSNIIASCGGKTYKPSDPSYPSYHPIGPSDPSDPSDPSYDPIGPFDPSNPSDPSDPSNVQPSSIQKEKTKIINFWDKLTKNQKIIFAGGIIFAVILIIFLIIFLI